MVGTIPGVDGPPLVPHYDAGGTPRKMWTRSSQPIDVWQLFVMSSTSGALRGMHYHLRQSNLCYAVTGTVFMALIDLRSDPPVTENMRLDTSEMICIPPGVAHGHATEQGAIACYPLKDEVDRSDEFGFRYDDPDAAIGWTVAEPKLSDRDRTAGTLVAAAAGARAHLTRYPGSST